MKLKDPVCVKAASTWRNITLILIILFYSFPVDNHFDSDDQAHSDSIEDIHHP